MSEWRKPYWTVRVHPTKGLQVWRNDKWCRDPSPSFPPSPGDDELSWEDTWCEPEAED